MSFKVVVIRDGHELAHKPTFIMKWAWFVIHKLQFVSIPFPSPSHDPYRVKLMQAILVIPFNSPPPACKHSQVGAMQEWDEFATWTPMKHLLSKAI